MRARKMSRALAPAPGSKGSAVSVAVALGVMLGLLVNVGAGVSVGACVGASVGVFVGVSAEIRLGDAVAVAVGVSVGGLGVSVMVAIVGAWVMVGGGWGVGVGVVRHAISAHTSASINNAAKILRNISIPPVPVTWVICRWAWLVGGYCREECGKACHQQQQRRPSKRKYMPLHIANSVTSEPLNRIRTRRLDVASLCPVSNTPVPSQ